MGLERAGFELILAVEKSDMAARTFFHNFIDDATDLNAWKEYVSSSIENQVHQGVLVSELGKLLEDSTVMNSIDARLIDVVVGGPPCQGFSLAGKRDRNDLRNKLPWEFLEFVGQTTPRAVVIENVIGMKQKFEADSESSFQQLQEALRQTSPGYVVQGIEVNAMHYGAPQHRPRLMIIGLRKDVASSLGVESSGYLWKSSFLDQLNSEVPALAPVPTMTSIDVRSVGVAIADLDATSPAKYRTANAAYLAELSDERWGLRRRAPKESMNNVRRRHTSHTTSRFRLYQFFASSGIDQRLLSRISSLDESAARLVVKEAIKDVSFPATAPDGTIIATTEAGLTDACLNLVTKKHSQKVLSWDSPSRTVVTIPDDYVHPEQPRLFSVRELARFQGFPEAFEFLGKETTGSQRRKVEVPQYSQVGNAVSPWLALAVGKMLLSVLKG